MKTFLYHLPIMLGLIGGETHAEADSRAADEEIVDTAEAKEAEIDRQVAQKLMDPDFSGMIELGSEEGGRVECLHRQGEPAGCSQSG